MTDGAGRPTSTGFSLTGFVLWRGFANAEGGLATRLAEWGQTVAPDSKDLRRQAQLVQELILQLESLPKASPLFTLKESPASLQVYLGTLANVCRNANLRVVRRIKVLAKDLSSGGATERFPDRVKQIAIDFHTFGVALTGLRTRLEAELFAGLSGEERVRTVVCADLQKYTPFVERLEQMAGAGLVNLLNGEIHRRVWRAIEGAGVAPESVIVQGTGDGFLALFDRAVDAWAVSTEFQRANAADNGRSPYRIGIATGPAPVRVEVRESSCTLLEFYFGGRALIRSVRLQTCCDDGAILVCPETAQQLRGLQLTRRDGLPSKEGPITGYLWVPTGIGPTDAPAADAGPAAPPPP